MIKSTKEKARTFVRASIFGGSGGFRTHDQGIMSPTVYFIHKHLASSRLKTKITLSDDLFSFIPYNPKKQAAKSDLKNSCSWE